MQLEKAITNTNTNSSLIVRIVRTACGSGRVNLRFNPPATAGGSD